VTGIFFGVSFHVMNLGEREAHLWIVRPESVRDPRLIAAYDTVLSDDERAKRDRYRFEKDRHTCLVSRALVRGTLSRYAGVAPAAFRFETNHYGRPEIVAPESARALRFNLSHTRGLAVLLVARGREVGVDVEDRDRDGKLLQVADRFFSPYEVRALHALPENERLDRFFFYWTLKESYIKARGMGLSIPLSQFSFVLDEERERGIRVLLDEQLGDRPERWRFSAMSFGRHHAIASAVESLEGEEIRLVVRETVPLSKDV
jgi:4'-phosphopantetheinyl transferase